ncbi:MAG: sulfite exporter TauE/SafE family protein, partial [Gammaproteobacteria bacterium]|nr:sulfite exporter TauE/SafE family protein [Gammaproteobacteria bacterium]
MVSGSIILLAAYVIRGITGFGSGLVSVPLLALFLPLQFVVPLILLLDFTASIV